MAIHLGGPLPNPSRDLPGRRAAVPCVATCLPYLILHRVGLAVPVLLPGPRWALTPPFHPCRRVSPAVWSLWRFPWGRPRRALPGTLSAWCPDFPPRTEAQGGHPVIRSAVSLPDPARGVKRAYQGPSRQGQRIANFSR